MTSPPAHPSAMEEIVAPNRGRDPALVGLKYRRMARDPFSFFRGTDHRFASLWGRLAPPDEGPAVLICGDLHLENFGGYRSEDGDFLYDINDFDEALVAPCSLDLVRCTTSILLAAQEWEQTPVQAMRNLLAYLHRYRSTVARSARTGRAGAIAVGTARGPIWGLLRKPLRGDQARLIDAATGRRGAGKPPRLERSSGRFRRLPKDRARDIREAVEHRGAGSLRVVDVASRVAGIGSLGLGRYAALVRDEGRPDGPLRLLDIKQIAPPALLPCAGEAPQLDDGGSPARRAVLAQSILQAKPAAGLGLLPIGGELHRIRDLIPEENRTGLERLRRRPRRLRRAVAIAGRLTAWAHVRGCLALDEGRLADLDRWSAGPGLDAVIASAIRYADRTRRDYKEFCRSAGALLAAAE